MEKRKDDTFVGRDREVNSVVAIHPYKVGGPWVVCDEAVGLSQEALKTTTNSIRCCMPTLIVAERPDTVDATTLIEELSEYLEPLAPPESRHGFSVEQLLRGAVAFFVMRHDGILAGCGGVELFGTEYSEIKRMYVRPQFRGLGLGKLMLQHLADYARCQGTAVLRLETGVYLSEAIGLYERSGFRRIPPFGAYREDPLSVFYEKRIT